MTQATEYTTPHSKLDTPGRKAAVLEASRTAPSIVAACRAAGVTYSTFCNWREADEEFVAAFNMARAERLEHLREYAERRAREGIQRQVIFQGQPQFLRDPQTGQLILDDDLEKIPVMEHVMETQVAVKHLEANLPEYGRGGSGASVGVSVPGANGPTKVEVRFVEAPNWDEVEWDEETGRAALPEPE